VIKPAVYDDSSKNNPPYLLDLVCEGALWWVWVPENRLTPAHLLLLRRWRPGMIPRWRCG
jgi:hypothetical protein